ncbi:hypothetical protein [Sphingobium sp.]|uniref:hypothetical protein n=1 Tax=Sphingobium sp. TaxID=1912891 RepID=UPI003BB78EC0
MIERIKSLLADDTDASVTYAALEARLALEKVCYDRLRQRHDYIPHAELRGWSPSYVMNKIMADVDENLGKTMTLMIGSPVSLGIKPEDDDYTEIGTEVGFRPRVIASMWNALSNLALHVKLPEHKDDHISSYGDKAGIRAKVDLVVEELERISKGTMTFSGFGEEVSFECHCGQKNKRRAGLLKSGQTISCFNPKCSRGYKVTLEDDASFTFELDSVEILCAACGAITLAPRGALLKMDYEQPSTVVCVKCAHPNRVQWILARADLPSPDAQPQAD